MALVELDFIFYVLKFVVVAEADTRMLWTDRQAGTGATHDLPRYYGLDLDDLGFDSFSRCSLLTLLQVCDVQ